MPMSRPSQLHVAEVSILPEQTRNGLLRRVDWRFLLPNPSPAKTVCFATGALADAVALISDVVVTGGDGPTADCDLAVTVDPDETTLRAAWDALRPGGSLYVEWRSCVWGDGAASRRLRRVGFRDVSSYWPYPNPARYAPQVWVPLESPAALRYFLRQDPALGSVGFVLRRIGRSLRARLVANHVYSMCTTATKPAVDHDSKTQSAGPATLHRPLPQASLRSGLLETIRGGWVQWGLGPPPDKLVWLLLARGTHSSNKVVAAVLAEPRSAPVVAVKMARTPEGAVAIQREAHNLEALKTHRVRLSGIPQPLFCQRHAGVLTLAETFIAGRPMASHLTRRTFPALVQRAADWLAVLAAQRGEPRSPGTWKLMVDRTLTRFESCFGAVLDRTLLRETRSALAALEPLPTVFEHRDYSPTNILITSDDQLGVLDWESAEPAGVPFLDLIYFITNAAFIVDGVWGLGPYPASYQQTWDPATDVGAIAHQAIRRYADAAGLESHDLGALRLLVWLIHAPSEYQRMVATSASAPPDSLLENSAFVSLWKEELDQRSSARTTQPTVGIQTPARRA